MQTEIIHTDAPLFTQDFIMDFFIIQLVVISFGIAIKFFFVSLWSKDNFNTYFR